MSEDKKRRPRWNSLQRPWLTYFIYLFAFRKILFLCKSLDDFTQAYAVARSDPSSFHYPYLSTLPTTCQNFACLTPSLDVFTVLGAKHAKIEAAMPVEASVVMSRWWGKVGLIPVLDLFNHAEATPTQFVKFSPFNR